MTFKEFNNIKITEEEQLLARACVEFNINPNKLVNEDTHSLIRAYKALSDYQLNRSKEFKRGLNND